MNYDLIVSWFALAVFLVLELHLSDFEPLQYANKGRTAAEFAVNPGVGKFLGCSKRRNC